MPRSLYHNWNESSRWYSFPAYKPMKPGRYLVTYRRPQAGKWIEICNWDGQIWTRNRDVAAWMVLPERYAKERR